MRRSFAIALIVLLVAACGDDDTPSGTTGNDPYGLTAAAIPNDAPSILAALEQMPGQVAGIPRRLLTTAELAVEYGDLNSIRAWGFEPGPDTGDLADDLGRFPLEQGAEVEASGLDRSVGLVWMVGSFPDQGGAGAVYIAVWGPSDGPWVFNVSAQSAEIRDEIVRAFLAAL